MSKTVKISFQLTEREARDLSELVKRAARRNLGRDGLDLVTSEEEAGAEAGLYRLRDAPAEAGFDPR